MAKFEKGHKFSKGRPQGSVNKRTLAEQACAKAGIDPFDLLVQKAKEGSENCIIQLCKHIEPPRKPLDVALDQEANTLNVVIQDYQSKACK